MKLTHTFAIALAVGALAACNQSPTEQAADNIEANAEMQADNLEEVADNASTEATEDSLENQADAVEASHCGDRVGPGSRGVYQDRGGVARASGR